MTQTMQRMRNKIILVFSFTAFLTVLSFAAGAQEIVRGKITDKENKVINTKSGIAVLGSMFFLASEMDEDSETGDGYGSSEYWDRANDCWFAIRVGIGKDHNGKQRAMLNYGCEDKNKQRLNLEDCPTLRTE